MKLWKSTLKKSEWLFHNPKDAQQLKSATLAARCKRIMVEAGIPVHYGAHSIRMAGATKMLEQGIPIDTVMKVGDWDSKTVFMKFYHRAKVMDGIAELMNPKETA
jgi:integrase